MMRTDRVMFEATVRALPFSEQCRATALAGCGSLTMSPTTYLALLNSGTSSRDIRTIAADHGIAITHMDPIARWTPFWEPTNYRGAFDFSQIAFDVDDFLRMANALGCVSMTALGTHPAGTMNAAAVIDHFGTLCERALENGLRVDLEFIPFFGVASLDEAWSILQTVNAPNSGLVFDLWHFRRSNGSEELLRSIPGNRITMVQLSDGEACVPAHVSLIEDCLARRRFPGDGDFGAASIVALLKETGGLNNIGTEIFSTDLSGLSAETIGRLSRNSIDQLVGSTWRHAIRFRQG